MTTKRTVEQRISDALTLFQVVALSALSIIDVGGVYPVADFLVRPDGSQQDPQNMLPSETVFVMLVAFPFLTIVLAFCLAPRKDAALIAASTHGVYILHQVVHYSTWKALFHPNTDITMEFFIITKTVWMIVSLYIWFVESKNTNKMKDA